MTKPVLASPDAESGELDFTVPNLVGYRTTTTRKQVKRSDHVPTHC